MLHRIAWLLLALFLVAAPAPLRAETDFISPIVTRLDTEGYSVTEIKRTWLGRILITAINATFLREIVLNRHTGEILRDRLFPLDDAASGANPGTMTGGDSEMNNMDDMPDDSDEPSGPMSPNSGGKSGSGMRP